MLRQSRGHHGFRHNVIFDNTVKYYKYYVTEATLPSNMVKIAPTVQKLQYLFDIYDGDRRHVEFYDNVILDRIL